MPAFFPKSTLTVAFNGRKSPAFCPCRSTLGPINTSKICAEPGPMKRRDGYKALILRSEWDSVGNPMP